MKKKREIQKTYKDYFLPSQRIILKKYAKKVGKSMSQVLREFVENLKID